MKPLRQLVIGLLLLLWLPCTMHCQLEAAGWLGTSDNCCAQESKPTAPARDCKDCATCQTVESGSYPPPNLTKILPVLAAHPLALSPSPILAPVPPSTAAPAATQPDFLRSSWRFVLRTALPPRAPAPRA